MSEGKRETFATSLGTLVVLVGGTIGLANVWRFPYMAGSYGGAVFVGVYLFFVLLFGIPAMMAEFTMGRLTRQGPVRAYTAAGVPGGNLLGLWLLVTVIMIIPYYTVVVGQVLVYCADSLFLGQSGEDPQAFYEGRLAGVTAWNVVPTFSTLLAVAVVLNFGVRRGIERVSRFVTPLIFLALALVAVRALTLPGASEGVRFFLFPDWSKLTGQTVLAALGQAFFSLSLGGTYYLLFGSYFRAQQNIPGTAVATTLGDMAAAMLAGFAILPAVFALGVEPTAGPSLIFITLPGVFAGMPGGAFVGGLFFGALFLANFLSGLGALQVVVDGLTAYFSWRRGRILLLILILGTLLALPSMASSAFLAWNDLLWGSTMMPLGSALAVVAVGWFVSRGKALEEVNRGSNVGVGGVWIFWIRYVIPPTILAVLVYGWWPQLSWLFQ